MPKRKILRFALLQEYVGDPFLLLDDIPEVAAKGYEGVAFFPFGCPSDYLAPACAKAQRHGLLVYILTGYMKYQQAYLARHPDQMLVRAEETFDQDGLSTSGQGCPFNPRFKARYIELLREFAALPAVDTISLNDEAMMGLGCYCEVCLADYRREIGNDMPRHAQPAAALWQSPVWRRFLRWRIDRWNAVHAEMAAAIRAVAPDVKVSFQASPASDLVMGNPWFSAIDIHAMSKDLDAFSTDPYYTFHQDNPFRPREVYLSEWSRFLAGILPPGKRAEIMPQAFTHPTFTRPLGEQDGLWAALVPPACGVDAIIPYTYRLQRDTPMHESFHRCFALHTHFERAEPLKYAAVVHATKAEIFAHGLPAKGPQSYDAKYLIPVSQSLRTAGVPYAYSPDRALEDPDLLAAYKVVILPEVVCVTDAEADGLRQFLAGGGRLIVLGQLGAADETGSPRRTSLLEELTGIVISGEAASERPIRLTAGFPLEPVLHRYDKAAAERFQGGTQRPRASLRHCVSAEAPADVQVIACFEGGDGGPAIVQVHRGGDVLWIAGFAERLSTGPLAGGRVNSSFELFAELVQWFAGVRPALRVEGWPPLTPIRRLRPLDTRNTISSFEFFPLVSDDGYLALATSYFREPASFTVALDVPRGHRLQRVHELIEKREVSFSIEGATARIRADFTFNDAAQLWRFEIEP